MLLVEVTNCNWGTGVIPDTHTRCARCVQTQALATDESLETAYRALQEKQMLCGELVDELLAEGDSEGVAEIRAMIENIERQKTIMSSVIESRPERSFEPSL